MDLGTTAIVTIIIVGLILCSLSFLMHLLSIIYAHIHLYQPLDILSAKEKSLPCVSILKPVCGLETNLETNLRSYFTMNYPVYEILFSVHSESDKAIDIIYRLMKQYPQIDSQLFIGGTKVGVNPKINNMYKSYYQSKYPLILISDSCVLMKPDTLMDMVLTMENGNRVGIVHQVPLVNIDSVSSFAHLYQAVYFGGYNSKMMMAANWLRFICPCGMSCLLRKEVLKDVGIDYFGYYLAEDYFLFKYFRDRNWNIKLSGQPGLQNNPANSIYEFRNRLTRWNRLRNAMLPLAALLEPFSDCLPNGLISAFSMYYLFPTTINPLAFLFCHSLIWLLLDYILIQSMYQSKTLQYFGKTAFFVAWIMRESFNWFYQIRNLLSQTIIWRGRRYRVRLGGIAEELPDVTRKTINYEPKLVPYIEQRLRSNSFHRRSNSDGSKLILSKENFFTKSETANRCIIINL